MVKMIKAATHAYNHSNSRKWEMKESTGFHLLARKMGRDVIVSSIGILFLFYTCFFGGQREKWHCSLIKCTIWT